MLKQSLQQKLLQKLSPQQIQLMKMLQLPTVALEARIKEELETNPALEEGAESFDQEDSNEDDYDDSPELSEAEKEFDFSEYMDDDDTNQWVDIISPTFSGADPVAFNSNITVTGNIFIGDGGAG